MKDNIIKDKSYAFAVRMVREAEHAETKIDFKHKMSIIKTTKNHLSLTINH